MRGRGGTLRNIVDVVPSKHRTRPLLLGTIAIAIATIALVSAALRHIPLTPAGGRVMTAEFAAADNVSSRTVVRVGGVQVGQVFQVGPGSDPYRTTLVSMRITDPSIHLYADATARIGWRTIFGGLMYIDLHPGSPSAPPLAGPIPASHTSNQVELDEVLDTYQGPTAGEQRAVLHGLRATFASPVQIGTTLHTLAPALETVDQGLAPLLGTESGDLRGLVAAAGRTVSGLDDTAALQGLVDGATRTLAVTGTLRAPLGGAMELLPPSLQSTSTTMRRLRTTLSRLDPLVVSLQPGSVQIAPAARAATPALGELRAVLRNATPLLRDAGPTFDSLRSASKSGVALVQGLNPTVTRLLGQLLPFLDTRDSGTKLKVYESIGPFFSSVSSAASEYDSIGHRIRLEVVPTATGFLTSPSSGAMTAMCDASALPRAHVLCPHLAGALLHSWFEPRRSAR
jgi:ABC-type transporter Mla subunit MlaD